MRQLAATTVLVFALGGCTLANLTPQARFSESTHTLNDASRWGRVDIATEQVSSKYRDRFVSRHRHWGTGISIADADITRMQIASDKKSALSEVTLSWYHSDGVTLRTSVITQRWEVEQGHFLLVDENVRVGDPSVLVEEPAPEGQEVPTIGPS